MKWLKFEVKTDECMEELVSAAFLDNGAPGVNVEGGELPPEQPGEYLGEEFCFDAPFSVSAYFACDGTEQQKVAGMRKSLAELEGREVDGKTAKFETSVTEMDEEDWASAWKAYFKPVKISNNVVIKPTWEEYDPLPGEIMIELDPGMAFGTGAHESTRMCVQLLEEYLEPGMAVADIGTGSGILAVAAEKLGAGEVIALDYDGVAVDAAQKNAALNGCQNIKVEKSDLLAALGQDYKADIMVANIIADIIIELLETAGAHIVRSGMLICSGIIDSRLADVLAALERHSFRAIQIREDGEWRAVACKYRG